MTRHLAALAASQSVTVRGRAFRTLSERPAILYTLTGGSMAARRTLTDAMLSQDARESIATHDRHISFLLFLIGA